MLLEKRQELWNKLLVLDSQSADRFKNRAGQLLQEEKERNLVAINIPKIEKRLLEATEEYERVHNEPFLIFGKRVSYLIDSTHKERDNVIYLINKCSYNFVDIKYHYRRKENVLLRGNRALQLVPRLLQNRLLRKSHN